jgi:hypothetical protein
VLATSFSEHHPASEFGVLIVDDEQDECGAGEPFRILRPRDLMIDQTEVNRRGAMSGPQGLVSSLKAPLLRHLVKEHRCSVLLLDADGCVYDDLSHVLALADEFGVVLSPHDLSPLSRADAGYPVEEMFLQAGVFNGGLLAVGPSGAPFLDWWADRSARRCIARMERGYLFSQRWLTLAAVYFQHCVLRDPGCNVMWWNLYQRDVSWANDRPYISGAPLRHFHFTGFAPAPPGSFRLGDIAEVSNFPGLAQKPGAARLCREYAARLVHAGLDEAGRVPPPFVTLPNGQRITDEERDRYRNLLEWAELHGGPEPTNPFECFTPTGAPGPKRTSDQDRVVKAPDVELARRLSTVTGLEFELAHRLDMISGLQSQLAHRLDMISGLQSQLAQRDETIGRLRTELAQRDVRVGALDAAIRERDAQLAAYHNEPWRRAARRLMPARIRRRFRPPLHDSPERRRGG